MEKFTGAVDVEEIQTVKFRGGKLSMLVIAAGMGAVFVTKFVPAFFPDFTGLGSLPEKSVVAMGCLDFESAAILSALHREATAPVVVGEPAAREFVQARGRGERAAGNLGKMGECADELSSSSPRVADEGKVEAAVLDIGDAIIDVYSARALALSIEFSGTLAEDGTVSFPDAASAQRHGEALASLQEAWGFAETRITALSAWIGEKTADQR